MNAPLLTEEFHLLAAAPNGVKKLRELILSLAVRGKLVAQDSNDEPASKLLERIGAEKSQLAADGKIRLDKKPETAQVGKIPAQLPEGWEWSRLGTFVHLEMGQSPPSNHYNQSKEGLPFFQGKADFGTRYPTARYWCTEPTKFAFKNDVLLSVRAPVGPTNICQFECCIGRGLAALRPLSGVPTEFVYWVMHAFRKNLEALATGTTFSAVSKGDLEPFLIPIPPLAEQHRIVAKVDELMAVCDALAARLGASRDLSNRLASTIAEASLS